MLSSTYHFWGVHNLHQAKSANSILESKVKLVCFFLFHFSLFVFHFSFFVIRFSFFVIRFCYSFFTFGLSLFAFRIHFSLLFFHFSLFVCWHSKLGRVLYFDIGTEAKYSIFTFKILLWHSNWGRISYFEIQNPIMTFKLRRNIVFWHWKFYFDFQTGAEYLILTFKILFWQSK